MLGSVDTGNLAFAPAAGASERVADRELEHFSLVSKSGQGVALIVEGVTQAEPEQAQGREPLHGDADRGSHLVELEPVPHHVVLLVLEDRIAEKERLSEIEEEARAHAARELGRHWQARLELA